MRYMNYTHDENDEEKRESKIIEFLKEHGKEIGKRGSKGCDISQDIMKYYLMLYDCWDGMTQVLIEEEIERYKKEHLQISNKTLNIT